MLEAMPQVAPRLIAPPAASDSVIKPLETRYASCRFRSRLEARWAVFFDHLGIEWQYEPECFKVAGKGYLPDFWLPELKLWAEVKGLLDQPTLDHLTQAVDPRCGLPGSPDGDPWQPSRASGRILLLGSIPRESTHGWLHTRLDFSHGQACGRTIAFHRVGKLVLDCAVGDGGPLITPVGAREFDSPESRKALLDGGPSRLIRLDDTVSQAYRSARMARFEHGESGAPQEVHDGVVAPVQVRRKRAPAPVESTQGGPVALSPGPPARAPQPELMPMPKRRTPKTRKVSSKSVELTHAADLGAAESHLTNRLPSASS